MRRLVLSIPFAAALAIFATGCGSNDPPAGATVLHYKLTDAGCSPAKATAPAGPIEFEVTNDGASSVTELEVKDGDTILGERENLTDGLSANFALTLDGGSYAVSCPNGSEPDEATLVVTGHASSGSAADAKAVSQAVAAYRTYVERNTDELVKNTKPFVAAVEAGDVATAKNLYVAARVPYEQVEPVAESFGNLDPEIDARAGDVPKSRWGGFHRIEQALYANDTTAGMAPVAKQLQANVRGLQRRVQGIKLQPAQIANGATELLNEVSASKITGEEERYSHTDLDDFQANVDGAQAAFDSVKGLLGSGNATLAKQIDKQFKTVDSSLGKYATTGGVGGYGPDSIRFAPYGALSKAEIRRLAQAVDALAEPLSQVASKVA